MSLAVESAGRACLEYFPVFGLEVAHLPYWQDSSDSLTRSICSSPRSTYQAAAGLTPAVAAVSYLRTLQGSGPQSSSRFQGPQAFDSPPQTVDLVADQRVDLNSVGEVQHAPFETVF